MRVIGDRVLVALPPEPDELTTESGLVLVKDPDRHITPSQGIVVQVGDKKGLLEANDVMMAIRDDLYDSEADSLRGSWSDAMSAIGILAPARFDVQEGDCVLFSPASGEELEDDGIRYVILREAEIIGVVEPKASAA